jgi:hypothetical protein
MRFRNCNFPMRDAAAVGIQIERATRNPQGFSFIRLGDGEGALLAVGDQSDSGDIGYFHRHLGPASGSLPFLKRLRSHLEDALQSADLVGIRDDVIDVEFFPEWLTLPKPEFLDLFRRCFRLREIERNLPFEGARRIALLHHKASTFEFDRSPSFCSAWGHYDLHLSGALFRMIARQGTLGLISCRETLPHILESLFGVTVRHYSLPGMFRDLKGGEIPGDYIERLESILEKRLVEFPGMLFLVGAGLYGKAYCAEIKRQGGIALDLGSLLDAWVGVGSRPTVYSSMFADEPLTHGVPNPLVLNNENVERMMARQKPNALFLGDGTNS